MGSCQNLGPFLGTLNTRCRIIIGTQKGTLILATTHMGVGGNPQRYTHYHSHVFLRNAEGSKTAYGSFQK